MTYHVTCWFKQHTKGRTFSTLRQAQEYAQTAVVHHQALSADIDMRRNRTEAWRWRRTYWIEGNYDEPARFSGR